MKIILLSGKRTTIKTDIATFFHVDDIAAVRACFGPVLPTPVIERVLELRIERHEQIDNDGVRHIKFYKDGKQHGECEGWYDNGQKSYDENFCDGKMDGRCEGWYRNGQKEYDFHYRDGKLDGKCIGWNWYGELSFVLYVVDDLVVRQSVNGQTYL